MTGSAYADDSRATSFLALTSPRGGQTVVQLSPFVPRAVAVAADRLIWIVGLETVAGREANSHHHIVRRFDPAGRLVASFVPRSSLVSKPEYSRPAEYSHLVSSKDRAGWYAEATKTYTEFTLDGTVMNQFSIPSVSGMPGIALCDDGSLFVSTVYRYATGEKGWGIMGHVSPCVRSKEVGAYPQECGTRHASWVR